MSNDELVEMVGRRLFREAAISPFAAVPNDVGLELGRRVLHRDALYEFDSTTTDRATVTTWGGKTRIVTPTWLRKTKRNWAVAFHVGLLALKDESAFRSLDVLDQQQASWSMAGWLTAPPEPFLAKYHQVGLNIPALASAFNISHSAAAMRVHEATGQDLALVVEDATDGPIKQERHVNRRGRRLSWLHDDALHELARKSNPKRVKKIAIRDAPARMLLVATS